MLPLNPPVMNSVPLLYFCGPKNKCKSDSLWDPVYGDKCFKSKHYYYQLLHFYMAAIRPILEYASPVWHYSITRMQTEQLESIQKKTVQIIFKFNRGMSYPNLLFVANINSLKDRRDEDSRSFFQKSVIRFHVYITSSHPLATLL